MVNSVLLFDLAFGDRNIENKCIKVIPLLSKNLLKKHLHSKNKQLLLNRLGIGQKRFTRAHLISESDHQFVISVIMNI